MRTPATVVLGRSERSPWGSQMHPCLGVREILELIAESCSDSTLASLSRVDHEFSDVALNKLWRFQKNLENLVKCLPSHLRDHDGTYVSLLFSSID